MGALDRLTAQKRNMDTGPSDISLAILADFVKPRLFQNGGQIMPHTVFCVLMQLDREDF